MPIDPLIGRARPGGPGGIATLPGFDFLHAFARLRGEAGGPAPDAGAVWETYRALLRKYNLAAERFLMVGNAMRSDILPVLEMGGWAVYVPHELTWSHETSTAPAGSQRFYEIEPELTVTVPVRPDGMISTPLIAGVAAEGKTATVATGPAPWLLWAPPAEALSPASAPAAETDFRRFVELDAGEFAPKVLVRFTSETGPPFLVERLIGRGRVLLATSGILSSWNTLPKTNAIVIFHRILRGMIQATLPMRNYAGVDRIEAPLLLRCGLQTEPERGGMMPARRLFLLKPYSDQLGTMCSRRCGWFSVDFLF